MNITITPTETAGVSRRLQITVPAETVATYEEQAARKYATQVRLPGFRPGKAPPSMVRKKFPEAVRQEAIEIVINEAFREAVEREGLKLAAQPHVHDLKAEPGQPLEFELHCEVRPELALEQIEGFTLTRRDTVVTDALVEEQIERIREQKAEWIDDLAEGRKGFAFGITEPNHGSDATHMETTAVRDGDEWIITGEKYYISGAGDPRCKIMITMVQTSEEGPAHQRQSQILVPMDTPGVKVVGPMNVFGDPDAPHGHMHIVFDNVRVPASNMLLGEGRGFEISQLRLGPGRIHHCMRAIGQAEKALDLMVSRGLTREAFGKPIIQLGGNVEIVSRARIEIEAMRLMVLKAAKAMDVLDRQEARIWIHMVKAMVPERVCLIIDQAIQMYGATGVSQKTPLARMYTSTRTLRLADGPDEVHHMVVGRHELRQYREMPQDPSTAAVFRN